MDAPRAAAPARRDHGRVAFLLCRSPGHRLGERVTHAAARWIPGLGSYLKWRSHVRKILPWVAAALLVLGAAFGFGYFAGHRAGSDSGSKSLAAAAAKFDGDLAKLRGDLAAAQEQSAESKETASEQARSSQSTVQALSGAIQSDERSSSTSSAQSQVVQGALTSSVQASTQTSDSLTVALAMSASLKTDFDDYRRKAEAEIFWWRSAALVSAGAAAGALAVAARALWCRRRGGYGVDLGGRWHLSSYPAAALVGCTAEALSAGIYELGHRMFRWW